MCFGWNKDNTNIAIKVKYIAVNKQSTRCINYHAPFTLSTCKK